MTLAVGIERRGRVWIGADSGITRDNWAEVAREPKVWRCGGWVLSAAGDWRAIQTVRLTARLPPAAGATEHTAAIDVAAALRAALEAQGIESCPTSADDQTSWLVGADGVGLWHLDEYWAPERRTEYAIGAAGDYALGWLDAASLSDPELRIRECIKAAAVRMPGAVRLPARLLAGRA